MKAVITGSYKAIVRTGAETFWKSEPEPKQIVSAPQHWPSINTTFNPPYFLLDNTFKHKNLYLNLVHFSI